MRTAFRLSSLNISARPRNGVKAAASRLLRSRERVQNVYRSRDRTKLIAESQLIQVNPNQHIRTAGREGVNH